MKEHITVWTISLIIGVVSATATCIIWVYSIVGSTVQPVLAQSNQNHADIVQMQATQSGQKDTLGDHGTRLSKLESEFSDQNAILQRIDERTKFLDKFINGK